MKKLLTIAALAILLANSAHANTLYWYGDGDTIGYLFGTNNAGTSASTGDGTAGNSTFTNGDTVHFGSPVRGSVATQQVQIVDVPFSGGDFIFEPSSINYDLLQVNGVGSFNNVAMNNTTWTGLYGGYYVNEDVIVAGNLTVTGGISKFTTGHIWATTINTNVIRFNGAGVHDLNIAAGATLDNNSGMSADGGATIRLTGGGTYIADTSTSDGGATFMGRHSGLFVIQDGTFKLGYNNPFSATGQFELAGGTVDGNGFDATLTTALVVSANSTINFVAGSDLAFAATTTSNWADGLNITVTNFVVGSNSLRFGSNSTGLPDTLFDNILLSNYYVHGLDGSGFVDFRPIPEPSSLVLFGTMAGAFAWIRWRRK